VGVLTSASLARTVSPAVEFAVPGGQNAGLPLAEVGKQVGHSSLHVETPAIHGLSLESFMDPPRPFEIVSLRTPLSIGFG
jgi:hypothetical protein